MLLVRVSKFGRVFPHLLPIFPTNLPDLIKMLSRVTDDQSKAELFCQEGTAAGGIRNAHCEGWKICHEVLFLSFMRKRGGYFRCGWAYELCNNYITACSSSRLAHYHVYFH